MKFILNVMRPYFTILCENMTSCDTDDVLPGKNWRSHVYCEIRRKYYGIFIKISKYHGFNTSDCCIVFWKKSQFMKYSKWRTKICKISQFSSDLKKKIIIEITVLFTPQKIHFCVFSVHFWLKKSTFGLNQNVNIPRFNHAISLKYHILGYETPLNVLLEKNNVKWYWWLHMINSWQSYA